MVAGRASPDDPAWTGYWEQRRRRTRPPVTAATWHLLRGRCPLCRGLLLHAGDQPQGPAEWQQWHTATRTAIRKHAITTVMDLGTPDERAAHHLIHARCCRRRISDSGTDPALLPGPSLQGLLEPSCPETARPVLRGRRRGNAPPLPDKSAFMIRNEDELWNAWRPGWTTKAQATGERRGAKRRLCGARPVCISATAPN